MVSSPLINDGMASCSSPALYRVPGCDRLRDRRRFLHRGRITSSMASSGAERRRALNIGALVIALFDVLRQIAGGAGMRRLLQNGQCIAAAAPRFQVSLALTHFLLPDLTLAGRAGGVVVHMRKRDGRKPVRRAPAHRLA